MRTMWDYRINVILYLLTTTVPVNGQSDILQVGCDPLVDGLLFIYINIAPGKFVYISRCASREGEFDGAGIPMPYLFVMIFRDCNIEWDVPYQVYLTDVQGVIQGTDIAKEFMCNRNTDPIIVSGGVTVSPPADISLFTNPIQSSVFMKITDDNSDSSGPPLSSAEPGDMARLHIWTDDVYDASQNPSGTDIRVRTIQVATGGDIIILTGVDGPGTYDGCKSKVYWGEVQKIQPGYVMVEFQILWLAPPGSQSFYQSFAADVDVCSGALCLNYNCSLNALGGSAAQGGRRKRYLSSEGGFQEVRVNTHVIVLPHNRSKALKLSPGVHEDTVEKLVHECEICTEKSAIAGLFASLASALILSLVINCLVYNRTRRLSTCKIRDNIDVDVKSSNDDNVDVDVKSSDGDNVDVDVKSSDGDNVDVEVIASNTETEANS